MFDPIFLATVFLVGVCVWIGLCAVFANLSRSFSSKEKELFLLLGLLALAVLVVTVFLQKEVFAQQGQQLRKNTELELRILDLETRLASHGIKP